MLRPMRKGKQCSRKATMAKKEVFVSFDFDNDKTPKTFLIGQVELVKEAACIATLPIRKR